MSYKGIDTAAHISADAAKKLKALGVSFAGRYLVPPGMGKELTADEARTLHDAGLAILLVWELEAERALRGGALGASDGAKARALAREMGVPTGAAVFFAVDFLPRADDYDAVEDYFRAAQSAVAPYRCGIYGPYDVVKAMRERIPQLMVWQCVGWSGGKVYEGLDFYQRLWSGAAECKAVQAQVGFPVDLNAAEKLDGLWQPPAHWYDDTLRWALESGVVAEERPTDPATRAEVLQMLRNYHRHCAAEKEALK